MKTKVTALIGACSAIACTATPGGIRSQDKPNVLLIVADDLGYGDLGCYGNPYIKTPNLDRLASEGVRFTQAYAGSAVSSPSRCALLTGLHTGHTRIRNNFVEAGGIEGRKGEAVIRRQGLTPPDTTVADRLRRNGYATALVNKWHLDGFDGNAGPLDHGFDSFRGWLISTVHSNDPYYYPFYRFHQRELIHIPENADGQRTRHNNDISTEDALLFLDGHRDSPFFLYLAYDAPHEPYIINDTSAYDGFDWDSDTRKYAALVSSLDRNIGRVLRRLDELSLTERTMILFVSDNGGAKMAPHRALRTNGVLRGHKGNFYEGGIRVPVIVKTASTSPGVVSDEPVYFPDLLPTILEFTGSEPAERTDGISLMPLLNGKAPLQKRPMFWEFPGHSYAVRIGPWKLVHWKDRPSELYHLDRDISETTDLALTYPEIVRELENIAQRESEPSPNFPSAWPLR